MANNHHRNRHNLGTHTDILNQSIEPARWRARSRLAQSRSKSRQSKPTAPIQRTELSFAPLSKKQRLISTLVAVCSGLWLGCAVFYFYPHQLAHIPFPYFYTPIIMPMWFFMFGILVAFGGTMQSIARGSIVATTLSMCVWISITQADTVIPLLTFCVGWAIATTLLVEQGIPLLYYRYHNR